MKVVQDVSDRYMGILNATVVNERGDAFDTTPLY